MSVSLDDVYVRTCLQILEGTAHQLDKAEDYCTANGLSPETVTEACLAPDMWPFARQVMQVCHHSAGTIAGVRQGVFGPELNPAPNDFASLKSAVRQATEILQAVPSGELDAIASRDMRFEFGPRRMDFTVADFLLSFSLPNFFFHAATAYGILRHLGIEVGKRDFLGQVRLKP